MTAKQRKLKQLMLAKVHVAVTLSGAILAFSDQIKNIPVIPGWLGHLWPHVFAAAMLTKTIGQYIITHIEIKHLK